VTGTTSCGPLGAFGENNGVPETGFLKMIADIGTSAEAWIPGQHWRGGILSGQATSGIIDEAFPLCQQSKTRRLKQM